MDIITLALAKKQIGKDTTKAVSDYLDEHLTNPTNPPLDTSLSIAGAAADSKATGDKLSELKEGFNDVVSSLDEHDILKLSDIPIGTWITGSYINTNVATGVTVGVSPVSNANYAHLIIPVVSGDKYTVTGSGGVAPRLWALTDNDYKLIRKTQYNSGTHTEEVTATASGYLIVNSYVSVTHEVTKEGYTSSINARISAKEDTGFYDLNDEIRDNNFGYIPIGDVGSTISYNPVPSSSWLFGVFEVKQGDVFKITGSGGNTSRLWCFVDDNDTILSKSNANITVENYLLQANNDGKLVINVNYINYNVQKLAKDVGTVYSKAIDKAGYNYRNEGMDILSAFSNVTCCGDSLTASVVYTKNNGDGTYQTRSAYKKYPWILGQKIGAEAESVATGGYSASDWWGAYADRIINKTNQLIVIYLGTNGGLTDTLDTDAQGTDYTQYANTNTGNYCKIVAKALSVGARVLLIKIHQGGGENVFLTNSVIDKIAEKYNVAVVDVPFLHERKYHAFPDNSGINTLHYNDLGYAAFADSLIKNVGALPNDMAVRLIPQ